ncbi:hypothetical protein [Burkholderia sp. 22313]|uniref:hypothetical protein n=1 Tax=Burkholderia sp. 22313 TaxID=3453908 RepID=UPI003F83B9EA
MKGRNDLRFATTGSASRRAGRMRAPHTDAGIASVARVATTSCSVARGSLSLRRVRQLATAPLVAIAIATAALSAGNPAMAAMAAAATLACAIARRIALARAASFMPSPARRRPFSSVRLTLMQDHSS